MRADQYDFIIVGGGLAGTLLLRALQIRRPHLRYLLIEKGARVGGSHNWSFHDADLSEASKSWFLPLVTKTWSSYEVSFPEYSRTFDSGYHCLSSAELGRRIQSDYPKNLLLNADVSDLQQIDGQCVVTLADGKKLTAETIVLARGWNSISSSPVAWQKFVGMQVELEAPHGLDRVLLMDAKVPQIDGFRFFYLLPWDATRLLVEDTYYSTHTILKVERIEREIMRYLDRHNWKVKSVESRESGMFPLMLNLPGNLPKSNFPKIGAASGFFHPTTGYTAPTLLRQIDAITEESNLTLASICRSLEKVEHDSKIRLRYYWLMNRLLFHAASPTERYRILSHFYKMPESLIQRFYAGDTNFFDQVRMLAGKPPVPLKKAFQVLREGL